MKSEERLEQFIKNNREDFDNLEPSPEVWKNIQSAQDNTKKRRIVPILLRVAAVFAAVIIASAILFKTNILVPDEYAGLADDPELRELVEAESYYAHQVDTKLKEIRKCYYTYPELKQEIESDITELETMYMNLKKDLRENVSNKEVIEAMIENNRYRLKLVDDVLEQINC